MTAPEDPNGLREALARCIDPDAWQVWDAWKDRPDGRMHYAAVLWRDKSLPKADALIAGPLASLIAERDAANKVCDMAAMSGGFYARTAENMERRALAAEAEITRLKEGMEARDAALRPFAAGGPWGGWLSWLINGAPDREQGKAAAKQIVHWRAAVDVVLSPKEQL